jgi:muramoyltetrapeptide carboxypeptidase
MMQFLKKGDTIGIVSPSHVVRDPQPVVHVLENAGYRVVLGKNLLSWADGYAGSVAERAEDFNAMVHDDSVRLVFFGGGESSPELLPFIDYEAIRKRGKLFCSYSDGTSILEAIHAMCGIETFYGQSPTTFLDGNPYDLRHFKRLCGDTSSWEKSGPWVICTKGKATGKLIGGYTRNFALMLSSPYFPWKEEDHILFLEDHEKFSEVGAVACYLASIAQSPLMKTVKGLLFGHYAEVTPRSLIALLKRFGEEHQIPVAYSDDFGHGKNHAILPIGRMACLDTETEGLTLRS